MEFNRPPRIQEPVEFREIVIPTPKQLPSKPKVNWLTLGLPLVGSLAAIGLMFAFLGAQGGISILFFLPMIFASVAASIITNYQEKKEYKKQLDEGKAFYSTVLSQKETELAKLIADQRRILLDNNPDLSTCLQWAENGNLRLGERRPDDADFLAFRIGLGKQKATLDIKTPGEDGRDDAYLDEYRKADALKPRFSDLENVPILPSLLSAGCIGMAGGREQIRATSRAALVHLVTHHWPTEMNLSVFCDSVSVADEWEWVGKLQQHRTRLLDPIVINVKGPNKDQTEKLEIELHRRQALLYQQKIMDQEGSSAHLLPALIVIFDHLESIYDQAAFSLILKEGRSLGAYGIILADRFEQIPGECGATIEFIDDKLILKETGVGKTPIENINPDHITIKEAEDFSISLAAIDWLIPAKVTEPPDHVSLLEMFGSQNPDDLKIEQWWDGQYSFGYLRTPIGRFTNTADLIFDLNESGEQGETHGPHGVIGGMTGSGKSELLRTIILSLALTHHPYDVNFALVDYKGGGAFKDLENLPHVVGVMTDIESHANYAGRVIQALTGEINIRKQILSEAQAISNLSRPHIDDYRQLTVKRPLPRLIIIFDEFAEFKDQHPDEARKLINIARQGRSLGVHLILCTQNPAAAIDNQVRQNSKFAISLSVNSPDDSRNLIGTPDAFGLPKGQAFIFVKSPQKFQVAFTGDKFTTGGHLGQTQAQAIVNKIIEVNSKLGLEKPPKVWPAPLTERLYLPDLIRKVEDYGIVTAWNEADWNPTTNRSIGYLIGLFDDPARQRQPLLSFGSSDSKQNLLVFGASQSGKSSLLLTLAIGIARINSPDQAHIYLLDLGGKSLLYKLKDLPHVPMVGGVITGDDKERINSLFSLLRSMINQRKERFQLQDFGNQTSQIGTGNEDSPSIYLLIDGLNSRFTESMDGFNDQLADIILEGNSVGVHVVITANILQDVFHKVFSYIPNRLILRPVEKNQVDNVIEGVPSHLLEMVLRSDLPAGRGLLGGNRALEFQTALPVEGSNDDEQSYFLDELISRMNDAWKGVRPPGVRNLPRYLSVDDLHDEIENLKQKNEFEPSSLHLGLGRQIKPLGLSLEKDGPAFLVTSAASQQGKTVAIQTWLTELSNQYSRSQLKILIVDFHSHSMRHFAKLPHVPDGWFISRQNQLEKALKQLKDEIAHRKDVLEDTYARQIEKYNPEDFFQKNGYILIVVDDYNAFRLKSSNDEKQLLKGCIVDGEEYGIRMIISDTGTLLGHPGSDDILRVTRSASGLSLGGFENLGTYFNDAKVFVGEKTTDFPPGRGYLVLRGVARLVQVATCCPEGGDYEEAIKRRIASLP